MTKGEIAKNNFMQGYNCAQAVLLAFCDDLGFDEQTALMLASPFGGGIGRMREVCGTVTGMYMALGLARGYSDSKDNADDQQYAQQKAYRALHFFDPFALAFAQKLHPQPLYRPHDDIDHIRYAQADHKRRNERI